LKYALVRDVECQRILSAGLTYEMPVGTGRVFQGIGGGDFHLFLTGGKQVGCYGHWLSAFGWRLPSNPNTGSQSVYWSNHFDYQVTDRLYAVGEINWFHWTRSGGVGATMGLEGNDLINLGSTNVAGKDITTMAFGARWKWTDRKIVGIAYEFPLTTVRDLFENRLTVDLILRY
jgi:hypothetical protein